MAPVIDLMDETFVMADRAELAAFFHDPGRWREWWPALRLTVREGRGLEGIRWTVAGELAGSAEVWLERWHDGVVVHWYLRADPADGAVGDRAARRIRRRYTLGFKARVHELKDRLEAGRPAGVPRLPPPP